ncbi:MAG: type II toxin-antitoxin system RelE/ParE family toxin [Myxococcales bacterium]|nr:type II toxin-antitoxin system RelE/ParE family toxin [Myxococcales bacterium]
MKYQVTVAATAILEVELAADWYLSRAPIVAQQFVTSFAHVLNSLEEYPLRGNTLEAGSRYRQVRIPSFPYLAIYTVNAESVTVLAVAHERRQPLYWLGR